MYLFDDFFTFEVEDDISDSEESDKKPKLSFGKILIIILYFILFFDFLEIFVIIYFTFCGFAFLTIDLFTVGFHYSQKKQFKFFSQYW